MLKEVRDVVLSVRREEDVVNPLGENDLINQIYLSEVRASCTRHYANYVQEKGVKNGNWARAGLY